MDRYIVRKYILANSAQEAIDKDKKTKVHDVWIDDDYKKNNELESCIGFKTNEGENGKSEIW